MLRILFVLTLFLAASSALNAAQLFVDGSLGNDANAGTSAGAGAKRTIQAGVNAAAGGDTVSVAAGIYVENVSITTASIALHGAQSGQDARTRTIVNANETILRPASTGTVALPVQLQFAGVNYTTNATLKVKASSKKYSVKN